MSHFFLRILFCISGLVYGVFSDVSGTHFSMEVKDNSFKLKLLQDEAELGAANAL